MLDWFFPRKAGPIQLESMIVPSGSTVVLRSKAPLSIEEIDRMREAVQSLQKDNPTCSIVLLPETEWDVVVIGAKQ